MRHTTKGIRRSLDDGRSPSNQLGVATQQVSQNQQLTLERTSGRSSTMAPPNIACRSSAWQNRHTNDLECMSPKAGATKSPTMLRSARKHRVSPSKKNHEGRDSDSDIPPTQKKFQKPWIKPEWSLTSLWDTPHSNAHRKRPSLIKRTRGKMDLRERCAVRKRRSSPPATLRRHNSITGARAIPLIARGSLSISLATELAIRGLLASIHRTNEEALHARPQHDEPEHGTNCYPRGRAHGTHWRAG